MKKILSIFTIIGVLFTSLSVAFAADNEVLWNASGSNNNINNHGFVDGTSVTETYGGTSYVTLDPSDENTRKYFIDIDDTFANTVSQIELTVKYFKGNGDIDVLYSSYSPDVNYLLKHSIAGSPEPNQSSIYSTTADKYINTTTESTFNIPDAMLNNGLTVGDNPCDICLVAKGSKASKIVSVTVSVTKKADVVMEASTQKPGNIFGSSDVEEQHITVKYTNVKDTENTVAAEYVICDEDDNVLWSYVPASDIFLSAGESRTEILKPKINKYGVHKFRVFYNNSATGTDIYEMPFTVINKSIDGSLNPNLNVCTNFGKDDNPNEILGIVKQAGFGGIRDGALQWFKVEREKGILKMPANVPDATDMVYRQGMDSLVILGFGNNFYETAERRSPYHTTPPTTPEALDAFANYCRYVATQYKGKAKYYEVWNEFNTGHFNWTNESEEVYAKLLKTAYDAVKSVDSTNVVVAMCPAGARDASIEFIQSVLQYDVYDKFDAISIHPYKMIGDDMTQFISKINADVAPYGDAKPIWYSECGYPNTLISLENQTNYGVKLYAESMALGNAQRMYWYNVSNIDVNEESPNESNFGLVKHDDENNYAKPIYVAFAGLNKLIGDAHYVRTQECDATVYVFSNEDTQTAVCWNDAGDTEVQIELGTYTANVYDVYSNYVETLTSDDGVFTLTVSEEPCYLQGVENTEYTFSVSQLNTCTDEDNALYTINFYNPGDAVSALVTINASSGSYSKKLYEKAITLNANTNITLPVSLPHLKTGEYQLEFAAAFNDGNVLTRSRRLTVTRPQGTNEEQCTANYDGATLTINGISRRPKDKVTVLVTRASDGSLAYVDQILSAEDSLYSFSTSLSRGKEYKISVYCGKLFVNPFNAGVSLDYKIYRDGIMLNDFSDVVSGDDISVVVNFKGVEYYEDTSLQLFGVIDNSGRLVDVKAVDVTDSEHTLEFHIADTSAISDFELFLWDKLLTPIIKPVVIK